MTTVGSGAWWWRRARVHAGILAAQALVVAAAVVLVAIVLGTVGRGAADGVRDYLGRLDDADATLTLATSPADDTAAPDGAQAVAARAIVAQATAGLPVDLYRRVLSTRYTATGAAPVGGTAVRLAAPDGVREHARLVAGAWPGPGSSDRLEAVIPADLAARWGASAGTVLRLTAAGGSARSVLVTGVLQPDGSGFWSAPVALVSCDRTSDPSPWLVVDPAAFRAGPSIDQVSWTVVPRTGELTADDAAPLAAAVTGLPAAFRADPAVDRDGTLVAGRLGASLTTAAAAVSAATGVTAVPIALTAVFCLVMLVQLGRLLVDDRRPETALLLSRGLSARRLAGWTALEVLVPAAVGAAVGAGVAALTAAARQAVLVTAGAAVVAAVATAAVPAWRAGAARLRRDRLDDAGRRSTLVAGGVALAAVALAAVALWRFRRPGAQSSDPFVPAAPALVLAATGLLAVLVGGVLAATAARVAGRRGRGPSPALPARQVARRGTVFGAAVLLLSLAVGGGVVAACYAASVDRLAERTDRAVVGPDVRVTGALPVGSSLPDVLAAVAAVDGVRDVSPVTLLPAVTGDSAVRVVGLPADRVTGLWPDVGGASAAGVAAAIPTGATAAPTASGPVRVTATVRGLGVGRSASVAVRWLLPSGALVTQQAALTTGDDGVSTTDTTLAPPSAARLAAVEISLPPVSRATTAQAQVQVFAGGSALTGTRWPAVGLPDGASTVSTGSAGVTRIALPPSDTGVVVRWLAPGTPAVDVPLPVVVPAATAAALGLQVGDELTVQPAGTDLTARVAAVVPYLPGLVTDTSDPGDGDAATSGGLLLLADLTALDDRLLQLVPEPASPSEIWAAAPDPAAVRSAVGAAVTGGATVAVTGSGAALTGIGVRALVLGAIGAALLALAAVAVVATTLSHRRRPEVVVLAALGVPAGQQAAMRRRELLAVTATGWVLGLPAGLVTAVAVVPGLAERAVGRRVVGATLLADPVLLVALLAPLVPAVLAVVVVAAERVRRQARRPELREVVP